MAIFQLDLFGNPVEIPLEPKVAAKEQKPLVQASPPEPEKPNPLALPLFPDEGIELEAQKGAIALGEKQAPSPEKEEEKLVYSNYQIGVRIKKHTEEPTLIEPETVKKAAVKEPQKSEPEVENVKFAVNWPSEETLRIKLYYRTGEVAKMFGTNSAQIRYWENKFEILPPRKAKGGIRLFRQEDIRKLELVRHLLKSKKYSVAGAKAYLKTNKSTADVQVEVIQTLTKFRSFLLELKQNLGI